MVRTKMWLLAGAGLVAAIAIAPPATIQAQEQSGQARLFDQPLRKQVLPVPANPQEHGKGTLTCFYYPHLMVKEADYEDYKGAGLLAITYLAKEKGDPACRLDRAENERQIQDWEGNFLGVKGGYVFFAGADGDGSGMPFAVYTDTGNRVLTDSGVLYAIELTGPPRDPDLRPWYTNPLLLRYHRSYLTPCSLRANGKACWRAIRRVTGLAQAMPPDCGAAYASEEKADPSRAAAIRSIPSSIGYDVETTLDSRGVIRITPIGPAGKCYPAP